MAEQIFTSSGWVAYRVDTTAPGIIAFDLEFVPFQRPTFAFALWVLDGEGEVYTEGSGSGSRNSDHVRVHAAGVDYEQERVYTSGGAGYGWDAREAPPGSYTVVLAVGSTGPGELPFQIIGPNGTTVAARSSGTSTFLHLTKEFRGSTHIAATQQGVGAHVIQEASIAKSVSSSLFGFFAVDGFAPGQPGIGYDGPDGSHDGSRYYDLRGSPAGSYDFRVGTSVVAGFSPEIVLLGADVTLP